MSGNNIRQKSCSICNFSDVVTICSGCKQLFCIEHSEEHQNEIREQINKINKNYSNIKHNLNEWNRRKIIPNEIDRWESNTIEKVKSIAEAARKDFERLTEQPQQRLTDLSQQLSENIYSAPKKSPITEKDLKQVQQEFEDFQKEAIALHAIELDKTDPMSIHVIKRKSSGKEQQHQATPASHNAHNADKKQDRMIMHHQLSQEDSSTASNSKIPIKQTVSAIAQSTSYPNMVFGLNASTNNKIQRLFQNLQLLEEMNKNGPMSGKCDPETTRMEGFLAQTFGFKNIPGKFIVQGVSLFKLDRLPHTMPPKTVVHFPHSANSLFAMTVQEIIDWQSSYRVYADKSIPGITITNEFLSKALQGRSEDCEEAFLMKFVVRISTCPILMEFDAKIISRSVEENWPNRIKLVSVTGIDFAGRKHDVGDIVYYISNWKDVFEVDPTGKEPALLNERDFRRRRDGPAGILNQSRLFDDLKYMAKLRLRACDTEGVQIVVETGIGLGVFSGQHIGIDAQVRRTSAIAIKTVLEEDGPSYNNIRAVVFALPIFAKSRTGERLPDSFDDFAHEFEEPPYRGPIPVMVADQDMHRLTVAIARQGFVVSELNPADSHGVFGEYWQNRGPAVEEKLALTTVGLLVQHHLINPQVLNPKNYHLI